MQPRELVARWREEEAEVRGVEAEAAAKGMPVTAAGANNAALAKEQCASELEAALAEQDGEIERLRAALDDAERGARSDLETELWAIIDRDGFAGIVPSDIHDAVSRLVKMAEQDGGWTPSREASIRDLAVAIVDLSCGYTMEFAPSPAQHRSTYDFVEEKIRAEIKDALAETGDGWVKIEDIPESWKDGRIVHAAYRSDVGPPFGPLSWISGRWHSWATGTESAKATHARLVTPPPCA